ncbi:MAG TPA: flagellar basal body L-ring protein FlgH [Terriglobales bacterium]|nr:flagellar basal body L-ring protein FlgH [Terriglobales bacterium]
MSTVAKNAISVLILASVAAAAKSSDPQKIQQETLTQYVQRMQQQSPDLSHATLGSLWTNNGRFADMNADYKAMHVGDLITIVVAQGMTASNANTVSTARTFNASSGISALAGHLKTSGVQQIFSPQSSQNLAGKSQGSTTSTLNTTLAGRVVAVLPSRALVIEAERQLTMNNEKQTIVLRGLVRQGDIAPDGSVPSNSIANLELELKGKGVLSDGTRPPNPLVRTLLKIVGF